MKIIDWEVLRLFLDPCRKTDTFDIITKAAFKEYVEGNDCFDDKNSLEIGAFYEVFKAGWAIRENL